MIKITCSLNCQVKDCAECVEFKKEIADETAMTVTSFQEQLSIQTNDEIHDGLMEMMVLRDAFNQMIELAVTTLRKRGAIPPLVGRDDSCWSC